MVKNLFKHLGAALSVVVVATLLLLQSCNNSSEKKETKDSSAVITVDSTAIKAEAARIRDSIIKDSVEKGEQTPPPK